LQGIRLTPQNLGKDKVSTSGYVEGKVAEAGIDIETIDIKIEGEFTEKCQKKPEFRIEFPPEETPVVLEGVVVEFQKFDSQGRPIRPNPGNSNDGGNSSNKHLDEYFRKQMFDSIRTSTDSGDKPAEVIAEGFKPVVFVYSRK
jgi:hypothetical protein